PGGLGGAEPRGGGGGSGRGARGGRGGHDPAGGATDALALVDPALRGTGRRRVGAAAASGDEVIDTYLAYLRDVRRMSPNTLESYARDLARLAAFAESRSRALDALDRRDLEAFVRAQVTEGLAPR